MNLIWTNPNFPDDAVRVKLHLSGPADTTKYLHDLIVETEALNDHIPFSGVFDRNQSGDHTLATSR